ncbi:zinc-binding dehydrogenase [Dongia deserti]|uniref:zinc-binding dehydrogenase n=1 Tax=Dongia deserti TaxID=2268030 RepID=UPI000E64E3B0|nr:zinc-binding dehydrogenase [Dongia deserti]
MTIPETMLAVRQIGVGDLDQLELVQVPVPRPGPKEVLVQVGACGLNNSDIMRRIGGYGSEDDPASATGWKRQPPGLPRIQGSDIAGTIVAVGSDVDIARRGHRVLVNPTLYNLGPEDPTDVDYLGSERDGGYAEYCVVPSANAHRIETDLAFEDLATFPIAYLTALHMLNRARVACGETVVVTGASGGVGSAVLQWAALRDARTVAIVGDGKENSALSLGAEHTVSRTAAAMNKAIRDVLRDRPVDVVVDVAGGPNFVQLLSVLRPGGRYVTCGAIAGPVVTLDLRTLYLKHLELIGSSYGTTSEFAELVAAIEAKQLKPLRAATFPLSRAKEAQAAFLQKRHFGNIILECRRSQS